MAFKTWLRRAVTMVACWLVMLTVVLGFPLVSWADAFVGDAPTELPDTLPPTLATQKNAVDLRLAGLTGSTGHLSCRAGDKTSISLLINSGNGTAIHAVDGGLVSTSSSGPISLPLSNYSQGSAVSFTEDYYSKEKSLKPPFISDGFLSKRSVALKSGYYKVTDIDGNMPSLICQKPEDPLIYGNFPATIPEGGTAYFTLALAKKPSENVNVSLYGYHTKNDQPYLTASFDVGADTSNGWQEVATFTPSNWNQPQVVYYASEIDDSVSDRLDTIVFNITGSRLDSIFKKEVKVISSETYDPDDSTYNIWLNSRNTNGTVYWNATRLQTATTAAAAWQSVLSNNSELPNITLRHEFSRHNSMSATSGSFITRSFVDDLIIYINDIGTSTPNVAGFAMNTPGDLGGFTSASPIPRVCQITIDPTQITDQKLYQVMVHEIGHCLGLVGSNYIGSTNRSISNPQQATFDGTYATQANGSNPIPLSSQDQPTGTTNWDFSHTAYSVDSVMVVDGSKALSTIDKAMLADHGYRVVGVNP
ncbi:hypothetical protein [Pantanalinema sp. GBBB05]|uniref:hypothetical protein n=1 Tax=Pantanalinema sp. GBBB05 TaxID=2604139 RepID=UPI001D6D2B2B|nr:hypothetical protein [Pantanalinema sp. GBBB05]